MFSNVSAVSNKAFLKETLIPKILSPKIISLTYPTLTSQAGCGCCFTSQGVPVGDSPGDSSDTGVELGVGECACAGPPLWYADGECWEPLELPPPPVG